ncbi:flavin reductase family protein [Methylobacterium terricola]|uniref:Flavin reductase family protein n=1 Tax=Methylobacterium terricola TaxID=2583531 RepID=A0A5C4LJ86_9HYPH|nr:flavin reductase family protein [Methylobacterium terricola]TNC12936.1 flavin reductase family protein [Methylobacterium terricola]
MAFDQRAFRSALSQFATGVAVITARGGGGEAIGLTMSSFNSVSLDPPLILFSVDRRARSLPSMREAAGYAVNILSRTQETLSNQFARSLSDKWSAVEHTIGHAEAPLLTGALAHFECEPFARHDGGDHEIFLGRVVRFTACGDDLPLVFFRGRYHGVCTGNDRAPEWPLPIHY